MLEELPVHQRRLDVGLNVAPVEARVPGDVLEGPLLIGAAVGMKSKSSVLELPEGVQSGEGEQVATHQLPMLTIKVLGG